MNVTSPAIMEKVVAAFEARRNFGKILNLVTSTGERFVVEKHGEPVAAVVPIKIYEQWKREREEFFAQMETIAQEVNLSPQDADRLAAEAVKGSPRSQEAMRVVLDTNVIVSRYLSPKGSPAQILKQWKRSVLT